MNTLSDDQITTFYLKLQNKKGLDLRDNRGEKHDLAFVLLGVLIGLFRNRDGNLFSLHSRILADLITLINNNLYQLKLKNIRAKLEYFEDNTKDLLIYPIKSKFL